MMLDDLGREGVLAHLTALGYTGTLQDWWAEVFRQSYGSKIRVFDKVWITSLGREYKHAQDFLRRAIRIAETHFDAARTSDGLYDISIALNRSSARRREITSRPLRLDGLSIVIQRQDDRLEVRVLLYVNNDFRRDRYFTFHPKVSKGARREP